MPRIAISYRRLDSEAITGRIYDRLVARYGHHSIFRDIDDVPLGTDFREHVASVLGESDIVLVIIGPQWAGRRGGHTRLDDPADLVRIEVETALLKRVPVIPLVIGRAAMPRVEQLPESLKNLAFRNGLQIDAGQDFDNHMERLQRAIDRLLAGSPVTPPPSEPAPQIAPPEPESEPQPPTAAIGAAPAPAQTMAEETTPAIPDTAEPFEPLIPAPESAITEPPAPDTSVLDNAGSRRWEVQARLGCGALFGALLLQPPVFLVDFLIRDEVSSDFIFVLGGYVGGYSDYVAKFLALWGGFWGICFGLTEGYLRLQKRYYWIYVGLAGLGIGFLALFWNVFAYNVLGLGVYFMNPLQALSVGSVCWTELVHLVWAFAMAKCLGWAVPRWVRWRAERALRVTGTVSSID